MAIVYPDIEIIKSGNIEITPGEKKLIEYLMNNLDENYNIYIHPYINGDEPDIVVMSKKHGIIMIKVKEENIVNYSYDKRNNSFADRENKVIVNPVVLIEMFKRNLFNVHMPDLFIENEKSENKIFNNVIKTAVYFPNEKKSDLKNLFYILGRRYGVKNTYIWVNDSNILDYIKKENCEEYMNKCIYKLKNNEITLFERLHKVMYPGQHIKEYGKRNITLSKVQSKLSKSESNVSKKIKGCAGSGKTIVLSHRAISALKRTDGKILILTYNITLGNYIRYRMDEIKEDFSWNNIHITHYHNFIINKLKELGEDILAKELIEELKKASDDGKSIPIEIERKVYVILRSHREEIKKYSAIFIDESQDFIKPWLDIIKDNFLENKGEFVIFADEKQNIYSRELDIDKKMKTNIKGRWSELNNSYRMNRSIVELAVNYQKYFFSEKYMMDDNMEIEQLSIDLSEIMYMYTEKLNTEKLFEIIKNNNLEIGKTAVLSNKIYDIRRYAKELKEKYSIEVAQMMETEDEYNIIKQGVERKIREKIKDEDLRKKEIKREIDRKIRVFRKAKKVNFYMDDNSLKISTIHSFKGWEIENIILILDDDANEELVYTAITRCKKNLIIINECSDSYDSFFSENIRYKI